MKTIFYVDGMDCQSEEKVIRNKLKGIAGINELSFNFISQELEVMCSFEDPKIIINAIKSIGMKCSVKSAFKNNSEKSKIKSVNFTLLLTILALVIALFSEIVGFISGNEHNIYASALAILAIILSGGKVFKKWYSALVTFTLNMNLLMLIAIIGAIYAGYLPEAAVITALFSFAELLERNAMDRVRYSVSSLMKLAPDEALVFLDDEWKLKNVKNIALGSILKIKPGTRIPMDGIVISGNSYVNQSTITGESALVDKRVGDGVYAGSINEQGSLDIKVSAIANNSLLSKIIHMVEQAQSTRAISQKFIDQFAKYYTPIMVVFSIFIAVSMPFILNENFNIWFYRALVLLVISCPCALVISTPVSIVSGLSAAARHGLLIKGGTFLEKGRKLKAIAFDKTGTLTYGKPIVMDIVVLGKLSREELLSIIASVDFNSEHPIARTIVCYANENSISLKETKNFTALPGLGVSAYIDDVKYFVGSPALMEDKGVCNDRIENILSKFEKECKTVIIVFTEKDVIGIVSLSDGIRNTAKDAVLEIHLLGLKAAMITGDNRSTAEAIGKNIGLNEIYADMLPDKKMAIIDTLIKNHKYVAMVGDGINDAPSLARASIGFAIGKGGTDITLETADIVMMENNLLKVPFFIRLSRKTFSILVQNISFAIFVKLVFFILALSGFATLWMAVLADMGASLIVIFNGLSLLRFEKDSY